MAAVPPTATPNLDQEYETAPEAVPAEVSVNGAGVVLIQIV
ncbi:MAG: hypothetical protein ACK5BQ_08745 [Ignavibacteria bacterium]